MSRQRFCAVCGKPNGTAPRFCDKCTFAGLHLTYLAKEEEKRSAELRDLRRVYRAAKKLLAEPDSSARLEELRAFVDMADETSPRPNESEGEQ